MLMEALVTFLIHVAVLEIHRGKEVHQIPIQWKPMVVMCSNIKTSDENITILLMWSHPSFQKTQQSYLTQTVTLILQILAS